MTAVLLTIHILIAVALITLVLLQRSEGGALGIGGGGGGGVMSGRGAANALTRGTSILAACFFATSIGLTVLAGAQRDRESVLDAAPLETDLPASGFELPGAPATDDLTTPQTPAIPQEETPEAPALPNPTQQ